MLVHGAALDRHVAPERDKSFLEAERAIDNDEFRRLQAAFAEAAATTAMSRLMLKSARASLVENLRSLRIMACE